MRMWASEPHPCLCCGEMLEGVKHRPAPPMPECKPPKTSPQRVGAAVANALGLPLDNLKSFTFSCDSSKATIDATYHVMSDGQLAEAMKSYAVVERE